MEGDNVVVIHQGCYQSNTRLHGYGYSDHDDELLPPRLDPTAYYFQ
jgi:hypothetical protein